MGRPIVLSNGQMFVGLDENGLVHDFYYPYVGLENLTTARSIQHKIGVWVDGIFRWTDDGTWKIQLAFEDNALISNILMRSDELGISLQFNDFIDNKHNAFVRRIYITNHAESSREVRLFMHQVFQISRSGRADTALYVPEENYLLDYKGRYCLLISGKFDDYSDFDQFAVGNYQLEGKSGTFFDAEDGELSNNPVEHGGVDSVIRFTKSIEANQTANLDYWIVAASSQNDAEKVHISFKNQAMNDRIESVRKDWNNWLGENNQTVKNDYRLSLNHSLMIIKAHCDERGSILASGDSSIFNYGRDYYCYCWPRDAAYALWPLIRLGHFSEAKQFFEFARDTMHKDGYLMHKYQPDRAIGSTWHPLVHGRRKELAIQEDETAIVVFMIGEYFEANSEDANFVEHLFETFVTPSANWMSSFVDESTGLPHASYDLWEEKFLTSTYTTSVVVAGLETATRLAKHFNRPEEASRWQKSAAAIRQNMDRLLHPDGFFRKGIYFNEDNEIEYNDTLDISSLFGPYMYLGLPVDDERLKKTAEQVEKRLLNTSPAGGVIRYEFDNYFLKKTVYKGNPWVVASLWLAQYYHGSGDSEKARSLVTWAMDRQSATGSLSEQYDPETKVDLSVSPLVWSHAELVNSILDMSKEQS
jgi:GH15 family glucan-1,4-alpha-glucosidase